MPNYDVHLFPVVRFTVRGIEAGGWSMSTGMSSMNTPVG